MEEWERPIPARTIDAVGLPDSLEHGKNLNIVDGKNTAQTSLLFSPRGETKCVRGPSVQGARRLAPHFLNNVGVLEQSVEHGEQAQRSNGGPMACFDRQVVRKAG